MCIQKLFENQDNGRRLPLHCACDGGATTEVIELFLERHPKAILEKVVDVSERLPLHCACSAKTSNEVIELLLEQHPETQEEQNSENQTPLLSDCTSFVANREVIELFCFKRNGLLCIRSCFPHSAWKRLSFFWTDILKLYVRGIS